MKRGTNHDKILLYWSGELDADASRKVEKLLREDPDARACYDELGEFWDLLDSLPKHEPSRSYAEEAIARDASSNTSRRFPWWRTVGAAAAVVLAATVVFQVLAPTRSAGPQEVTNHEIVPTAPVPERRPLLSSGSQFSDWKRTTSARVRIRHLRSQFNAVRAPSL